jgi:hypothetical protein
LIPFFLSFFLFLFLETGGIWPFQGAVAQITVPEKKKKKNRTMISVVLDQDFFVAGEAVTGTLTVTVAGPRPLALGQAGAVVALEGHEVVSWPDAADGSTHAASRALLTEASDTAVCVQEIFGMGGFFFFFFFFLIIIWGIRPPAYPISISSR